MQWDDERRSPQQSSARRPKKSSLLFSQGRVNQKCPSQRDRSESHSKEEAGNNEQRTWHVASRKV
jgi:hypothetical protein